MQALSARPVRPRVLWSSLVVTGLALVALGPTTTTAQTGASRPPVTRAQYEQWQKELSNWGRWGAADEMGTLNLVTEAKRKQAVALVKDGVGISMASTLTRTQGVVDVPCPVQWAMTRVDDGGATDSINFPCVHGPGITHLDAFGHQFGVPGKMWNGHPSNSVTREGGVTIGSIVNFKDGIVTRGVLYDIARLKGVPYLKPGERIFVEDLEAWERTAGVKAEPGDAIFLHTGRWIRREQEGPYPVSEQSAGLDGSVIPWLKRRDVAVLGWETPSYAPKPAGDELTSPVHRFALTSLGMPLVDRGDFTEVAKYAAAHRRWAFMVMIAPLRIPNGTGSPVNPIAMF